MDENTKTFLDKIKELEPPKFKVSIRSVEKSVDCSPLTFKQQKDIISTIAEGAIGVLKLQKHLNNIIETNTGQSLLVTDKIPVILRLRGESIGYNVKFGDVDVNIEKNVKDSELLKFTYEDTIKGVVDVNVAVPTIKEESRIISETIEALKKDSGNDGKNVVDIYTYEIVKFIKSVKFGDSVLEFSELPIKERVQIVDNLPLTINKKIAKFIQDIKKVEASVLEVTVDGNKKTLDIDVSFFDN